MEAAPTLCRGPGQERPGGAGRLRYSHSLRMGWLSKSWCERSMKPRSKETSAARPILRTSSVVPLFLMILLAVGPPENANLTLQTEPGTEVVWEGVSLGRAGSDGLLIIQGVPPGTFSVTLRKGGFHEFTTDIEVLHGEAKLVLELEAIPKVPPKAPPGKPPPRSKSLNESKKAVPDKRPPVVQETQVAKAPPELPVPAVEETQESVAQESVAEEGNDPAPSSGDGYYLLIALVMVGAGVYGLQKFKSIRETTGPDPPTHASAAPGRPAIPEPEKAESAPFLAELKAREKMMGQAVEIILPEPPRVIDIEGVREVEEES